MTPVEIALIAAIAALVYQEIAWRDRARRIETDYEKRLSAEIALAYSTAAEDDEGRIRALTFHAEKEEPRGFFREVTRHLFLAITMDGDTVRHAAGDLTEIDRFQMPPQIRKAVDEFLRSDVARPLVAAAPALLPAQRA